MATPKEQILLQAGNFLNKLPTKNPEVVTFKRAFNNQNPQLQVTTATEKAVLTSKGSFFGAPTPRYDFAKAKDLLEKLASEENPEVNATLIAFGKLHPELDTKVSHQEEAGLNTQGLFAKSAAPSEIEAPKPTPTNTGPGQSS